LNLIGKAAPIGQVMGHRAKIDAVATCIGQARRVRCTLENPHLWQVRLRHSPRHDRTLLSRQLGCIDNTITPDPSRHLNRHRAISRTDVGDRAAGSNAQQLRQPCRLARPGEWQEKE
jgi:hypothetical protein